MPQSRPLLRFALTAAMRNFAAIDPKLLLEVTRISRISIFSELTRGQCQKKLT